MNKKTQNYIIKRTNSGLGFFTLVGIPFDKRIIEYIGPIMTKKEADEKGGKYLMKINNDYFIDGSPRSNIARYVNHSCQPNSKAYREGVRIWIWSITEIEAGEEITINYGKKYFDNFIKPVGCKCKKCFTMNFNTDNVK